MLATTAPIERGVIDKSGTIHALDKHSGLPRCGALVVSVRTIDKIQPIAVDTPRADLHQYVTCNACLLALGVPAK